MESHPVALTNQGDIASPLTSHVIVELSAAATIPRSLAAPPKTDCQLRNNH